MTAYLCYRQNMPLLPITCDDPLLDHLPIDQVVKFSLVSKEAKARVASYMKRRFQIQDVLREFVEEERVESFRNMMARTQTVLSGSAALQFLARVKWRFSDVDLYVDERFTAIVTGWFKEPFYTVMSGALVSLRQPRSINHPDETSADLEFEPSTFGGYAGVRTVITFRHERSGKSVQIISCGGTPVQTIIKFHSTAVVNIISHNAAYCVYPKATLVRKISLFQPFQVTQQAFAALQKYRDRGWRVIQHLSTTHGFDHGALFPFGPRRLGDSKTFKIAFSDPIRSPFSDTIETNSWIVSYDGHMVPQIAAVLVRSERLSFSYILRGDRTREEIISRWNEIRALFPANREYDAWMPMLLR